MTDNDKTAAAEARAAKRAGQQAKMAWIKMVLAATDLGDAAKVVANTAAIHFAYSKGVIRAEHKSLATRCNKTARGIEKAVTELARQHYWNVETTPGRANGYTLISLDGRIELWNFEAREYRREALKWDAAKQQWEYDCTRWLEKEANHIWCEAESIAKIEFVNQIGAAILARGGDLDRAREAADWAWAQHQDGRGSLEPTLRSIANMPEEEFRRLFDEPEPAPTATPQGEGGYTPGVGGGTPQGEGYYTPGVGGPTLANAVNSKNDPPTSTSRTNKSVEVHTTLTSGPHDTDRARFKDQEPPRPRPLCNLCNDDGYAVSLDGERVIEMMGEEIDEYYDLTCRHSLPRNTEKILNIRESSNGYWDVNYTGYGIEVDGEELSEI